MPAPAEARFYRCLGTEARQPVFQREQAAFGGYILDLGRNQHQFFERVAIGTGSGDQPCAMFSQKGAVHCIALPSHGCGLGVLPAESLSGAGTDTGLFRQLGPQMPDALGKIEVDGKPVGNRIRPRRSIGRERRLLLAEMRQTGQEFVFNRRLPNQGRCWRTCKRRKCLGKRTEQRRGLARPAEIAGLDTACGKCRNGSHKGRCAAGAFSPFYAGAF